MSGTVGDNTARASGVIASASGGTILSVKSLKVTAVGSNTGTTPTQLSQFDMSFAPTTSDGKLYFQAWVSVCTSTSGTSSTFHFYDVTNTTIIGAYADSVGSRLISSWGTENENAAYMQNTSFGCWHVPGTTSSIDYTIFGNANTTNTLYINRSGDYGDSASINNASTASTFTITEYAADTVTLT